MANPTSYHTTPPENMPESIFRSLLPHPDQVYDRDAIRRVNESLIPALPGPPLVNAPIADTTGIKGRTPLERSRHKIRGMGKAMFMKRCDMATEPTRVDVPTANPNQPPPNIPTAVMRPISPWEQRLHKNVNACVSREEWAMYMDTWNLWTEMYGSNKIPPGDLDDIHAISMSTVREMREELVRCQRPASYSQKNVDAARKEIQRARENLMARKVDLAAIDAKKSTTIHNHMNIAVMAGEANSQNGRKQLEARVVNDKQKLADFFERTESRSLDPNSTSHIVQPPEQPAALPAAKE